ncbi:MAG: MFS transporter [Oscillospiraceae bacterium]|nr:MFS transporter [Oscillospiraceae bacterium]
MNKKHLLDTRTSITLFVYIWILYIIVYVTKNCFSGAMASIVNEGIMTKSQTGLITAMFYVPYGIFQTFCGNLSDRVRPDRLMLMGLFGTAITSLIIYLFPNYYTILIVWTLTGFLQFGIWPALFKIASSQLAPEHRARGVYVLSITPTISIALAFITPLFMKKWQDMFLVSSILMLLFAIGLMIIYPRAERKMVLYEDCDKATPAPSPASDISSTEIFKKCGFYILLPALVLRAILEIAIKSFSATLLMESYSNISPAIGNILNVLIILSGLIGMFSVKFIYKKFNYDDIKSMCAIFVAAIPFMLLTLLVGKISAVLIVIFLSITIALLSAGALIVSYYSVKFAKFGKNGELASITNGGAAFGIVIQSYGLSVIADVFGWISVLWIMIALVAISALLTFLIIPKWKKFVREYDL